MVERMIECRSLKIKVLCIKIFRRKYIILLKIWFNDLAFEDNFSIFKMIFSMTEIFIFNLKP